MSLNRTSARMRRIGVLSFVLSVMLSLQVSPVRAGVTRGSAIGIIIGDPTGFSWRLGTGADNSLAGAVGFSPHDHIQAHVDYIWHSSPFENHDLGLYYGVGGAAGFGKDGYGFGRGHNHANGFGVRVPVGLSYLVPESPVELLLEVAPVVVLVPTSGVGLNGGIGARIRL